MNGLLLGEPRLERRTQVALHKILLTKGILRIKLLIKKQSGRVMSADSLIDFYKRVRKMVCMSPVHIPESHRDLLDGGYCVSLTTVMPDGQPQITPIWCNREGDYVLINTMRGFRKERNMRSNPYVTLLAYNPNQPLRSIEIRGTVVEMTEEGALEHLDHLTQLYMHKSDARFFGDSIPAQLQATYFPVKVKIAPTYIRVEG